MTRRGLFATLFGALVARLRPVPRYSYKNYSHSRVVDDWPCDNIFKSQPLIDMIDPTSEYRVVVTGADEPWVFVTNWHDPATRTVEYGRGFSGPTAHPVKRGTMRNL